MTVALLRSASQSTQRLGERAQIVQQAEEVREYTERADPAPSEAFGSLADKLRGALEPRE